MDNDAFQEIVCKGLEDTQVAVKQLDIAIRGDNDHVGIKTRVDRLEVSQRRRRGAMAVIFAAIIAFVGDLVWSVIGKSG